jgi:O-antigen ligase
MSALERRIQSLVIFCVVVMTLIVTPWMNLDPINLPKFLVLVVCGLALLGNLALSVKRLVASEAKVLVVAVLVFVVGLLLSFFVSGAGVLPQAYGAYGRNTGLLTYLSLAAMLFGVVFVSNLSFVRKLIWALIATGMVNAVYGLAQWADLDPVDWSNPYNPIVGTLGNPNFTSAHLGIAGLASLAMLLGRGASLVVRVVLSVKIGLSLFVISQSDSSQGLLVFALGATVVLYFKFVDGLKVSFIKYMYWGITSGLGVVGVLGILNMGPLASYLYQDSVTYRGDYWRAGWKMTLDNPLFGVGLDSYGDWYRFSRTEAAALRRGPDVTSNSAHNVFLDISSNGGFFLLIAYLLIIGLVIRSAVRVLRKPGGFDAIGVGLVSAWLAYLAQSIISINQLGLAIWGWVLGGAIIGYDFYKDRPDLPRAKRKAWKRPEQVPASVVITGALGLVMGFVVSIFPVLKDISFRSALSSGDRTRIESVAKTFPQDSYTFIFASGVLLENSFEIEALELARRATEVNPRDFNAWKMLILNPKVGETEKATAIAKMKELDPFNNTLGD